MTTNEVRAFGMLLLVLALAALVVAVWISPIEWWQKAAWTALILAVPGTTILLLTSDGQTEDETEDKPTGKW